MKNIQKIKRGKGRPAYQANIRTITSIIWTSSQERNNQSGRVEASRMSEDKMVWIKKFDNEGK